MVGHLFEGVPTDLPRADELLLPMYSFFLRSIVPRTLNELKIIIDFDLIKCLLSPDLASLVVGAPDFATDPRTRRNRLLRRLWRDDRLILIEIEKMLVIMMIAMFRICPPQVLEGRRGQKDQSLCCCCRPSGSC